MINAINATVANAAVISSAITATANNNSDLPIKPRWQIEDLLEPSIIQQKTLFLLCLFSLP